MNDDETYFYCSRAAGLTNTNTPGQVIQQTGTGFGTQVEVNDSSLSPNNSTNHCVKAWGWGDWYVNYIKNTNVQWLEMTSAGVGGFGSLMVTVYMGTIQLPRDDGNFCYRGIFANMKSHIGSNQQRFHIVMVIVPRSAITDKGDNRGTPLCNYNSSTSFNNQIQFYGEQQDMDGFAHVLPGPPNPNTAAELWDSQPVMAYLGDYDFSQGSCMTMIVNMATDDGCAYALLEIPEATAFL